MKLPDSQKITKKFLREHMTSPTHPRRRRKPVMNKRRRGQARRHVGEAQG
jgi:hypothetical protein